MQQSAMKSAILFGVSLPVLWMIGAFLEEVPLLFNIHNTYFVLGFHDYMYGIMVLFVALVLWFFIAARLRIPFSEKQLNRYTVSNYVFGLVLMILGGIAGFSTGDTTLYLLLIAGIAVLWMVWQLVFIIHGILKLMKK